MIKPLNNNVVLKKEKKESKTASGIILSNEKEEPEYAIVVAVGDGKINDKGQLVKPNLNVGDKVVYKSYSPTKVKFDNEEYLILDFEDILAIIE